MLVPLVNLLTITSDDMAPSFLNSGAKDHDPIKHFEIRPDESNLIFRGSRDEASSVVLKGTLVLCLSKPLRIQGIRLRFTGEKRIGFYHSGAGPNYVKQREELLRKVWDFRRTSETLKPGNYEWPFDLVISGNTPESLEGMVETWLVYRLKATIERGMLHQDVVARKQIRVIRTLNPGDLELSHAMSVENVWTDKINYAISTPSKAVMFGSTMQIDFKLIPLLKGLVVGTVSTELVQKQKLELKGIRMSKATSSYSRTVAQDVAPNLQDIETEELEGHEGYQFSRTLTLPRSLRHCVQDFESHGIKIKHHLSFKIQLHNPDGHVSELHANLPIMVFISPNLPIGEDNNLVASAHQQLATNTSHMDNATPPQYGEHMFDQLYSDIDTGHYVSSRGPSGVNTPMTPRSRSISYENADQLAQVAQDMTPQELERRLSSINMPNSAHNAYQQRFLPSDTEGISSRDLSRVVSPVAEEPMIDEQTGGHFEGRRSNSSSQSPTDITLSRHSSREHAQRISPPPSIESLSKVPSYSTALHSNSRMPLRKGLPSYQAATCSSSMAWALSRATRA